MQTRHKRFEAVKFKFEMDTGGFLERYMIVDNHIPLFEANQWLASIGAKKASTGREYAIKLSVFLNWLNRCDVSYDNATNRHVSLFLRSLVYGDLETEKIKSIEATVGSSTLNQYITVITGFYKWLDDNYETAMRFSRKSDDIRARKSFLYGQIYSYDYKYIVDSYSAQLKPAKEYMKWYDDATKELLCSNFNTLRDEAVLRLTFEGLRIDEALSITLESFDQVERIVRPTRSKGKADAGNGKSNHLRIVALPTQTCNLLTRYIETERVLAETESGRLSQYIFINLNKGKKQGLPLKYHNYRKILRQCAVRAGLDPEKIRTHNGRSTKVMEFLEHQAMYPEDGITDVIIMESFGWKHFDSINHYRNHNNQIIAKAVMEKLHKRKGGTDD